MVDDQLANFTDAILENTTEDVEISSQDPELRALQQTVLRLKSALPKDSPSEIAIQRIRQNVVRQWKQEEHKTREPFWKRFLSTSTPPGQKWQPQESRRRQSLVIYLATAVFLLLISIPLMDKAVSAQPAASGQNLIVSIFFVFGGLVLLAVWFFYHKR